MNKSVSAPVGQYLLRLLYANNITLTSVFKEKGAGRIVHFHPTASENNIVHPQISLFLPKHTLVMTSYSPYLGTRMDTGDGAFLAAYTSQTEYLFGIEKTYLKNGRARHNLWGVNTEDRTILWNWADEYFSFLVQALDLENRILKWHYGPCEENSR